MDITETFYAPDRAAWRAWLTAHHNVKSEIWLVSYRVATGRPNVSYSEAVEEALCFGWIDSTRKGIDDERYAQRYTPRRTGSSYSQLNKERLARLIAAGQVLPAVCDEVQPLDLDAFAFPEDIVEALRARDGAWAFFASTAPSYQRIRVAFVDDARSRPEEFQKRLRHLVEKSAKGRCYGYGIEDFY